jgi:hypothetical protein
MLDQTVDTVMAELDKLREEIAVNSDLGSMGSSKML